MFEKRDKAWSEIKKRYFDYIPTKILRYELISEIDSIKTIENHEKYHRKVFISDSLDCALKLSNPLVLIFADDITPGGCVDSGNGMQEESLFRRTALFKYLKKEYYPLPPNKAIYCKDVPVSKNSNLDDIPTTYVSFIACPCIKMPSDILSDDELNILQKKIHLILGAWGCGVWGCNPDTISKNFNKISQCYKINTYYPILQKGNNYYHFNKNINNLL
jgi:hypothetical protein